MTWRMLKVFARESYDEMFKLAGVNVLWVLCAAPVVTLPPATMALYAFVHEVVLRRDPDLMEFFQHFRKWFFRSYSVFFILISSVIFPGWAALFYLQWAKTAGWVGFFLATLNLWLMVFCLAAQVYFIPFLVHQEKPILVAVKRAGLLVLLRPGLTFSAVLVWAVLWAANIFPPFFFFMFAALVAMLKMMALLVGLEEYDLDEEGQKSPALNDKN
jgi:uncharacterized membrane protein YesL